MNKTILHGFVGRDPELKMTPNGQALCRFSFATTERWVKDGEKKEKVEWHNIVVWGKQAESMEKWVKKGTELLIEGKIEYNSYADKDNPEKKLYSTHIRLDRFEFCGKNNSGNSNNNSSDDDNYPEPPPEPRTTSTTRTMSAPSGGYEDDIPF